MDWLRAASLAGAGRLREQVTLARRSLRRVGQSFRYSRSRFVCARLTGISVPFASFIRRM